MALAHPPGQLSLWAAQPPVVQLPRVLPKALSLQNSCLGRGVPWGPSRLSWPPHVSPETLWPPARSSGTPLPAGVLESRLEAVQGEGHVLGPVPRTHPPGEGGKEAGLGGGEAEGDAVPRKAAAGLPHVLLMRVNLLLAHGNTHEQLLLLLLLP